MNYTAFGLSIDSPAWIPGLLPNTSGNTCPPDIEIHWNAAPEKSAHSSGPGEPFFTSAMKADDGSPALRIWRIDDGELLQIRYADGVDFWMDRRGENVWAKWAGESTFDDAVSYFLGPIMGLLLRFRGVTCLHASAVKIAGRAVLFAGEEGSGKSTTAAALAKRGHAVLSDDISALEERGGEIFVIPSFACLSLWPESVSMVYGPGKELPEYSRNFEKRRLELEKEKLAFQSNALPLGAVFILGERSDDAGAPFIEAMEARDGLVSLVVHSYANSLIDGEMRAREFLVLGRLLSSIPVRRLRASREPEKIDALCETVERESALLLSSVRHSGSA